MAKRTASAAFLGALCLLLTACSTVPAEMDNPDTPYLPSVTTSATADPTFSLGYLEEDVFHPYRAKTSVNRQFSSLLYESLYRLDETLAPVPQLAAGAVSADAAADTGTTTPGTPTTGTVTSAADNTTPTDTAAFAPHKVADLPTRVIITLREQAHFSDGTAVTADDVVASFALAQKSARYQYQLRPVTSIKAQNSRQVLLTLSGPDTAYLARLTFPIIQKKTADEDCPRGSGPYYPDANLTFLKVSPYTTQTPKLVSIPLKAYTSRDALRHALGTGRISVFYDDLADGTIPRITAASSPVSTDSLVFLGFNSKNGALTADVRLAISEAIGRRELSDAAFAGYADPAVSPFHPRQTVKTSLFSTNRSLESALSRMEKAGYRTGDTSSHKKQLSATLLVSKGSQFRTAAANQIRESLSAIGVDITVEIQPYAKYLSALEGGHYDLYLGEIRLGDALDLTPFFTSGGTARYGITGETAARYAYYRSGMATAQEFLDLFQKELPFLPLCYRCSMAAYQRSLENVHFSGFDLFSCVQDWSLSHP